MKKFRVFSVLLLIISAVLFIGYKLYSNVIIDTKPPVITCESEEIKVPVNATEEDLMVGVTATDNRSGDVGDTLVLEKLSAFTADSTRIATYAAVDESMNVGRAQRTIVYEGYESPKFDMTQDLCFTVGSTADLLGGMQAESCIDGDLTEYIKYVLEKSIDTTKTGKYPIEYRVMDSGGKTVYLNTRVEIIDSTYSGITVELKDYLVYVNKGGSFDAEDYYEGASSEGTLNIRSNVDTSEEGVYYVDYIVKGSHQSGLSRLTVVVR